MKMKNVTLTILESLPFPARYHEENGKPVVTIEQEEIESFVAHHNQTKRALKAAFVCLILSTVAVVGMSYQFSQQPEPTIIMVDSTSIE